MSLENATERVGRILEEITGLEAEMIDPFDPVTDPEQWRRVDRLRRNAELVGNRQEKLIQQERLAW